MQESGRLDRGDGVELAWRRLPGAAPTVVFLPGFRSDMAGAKAGAVAEYCEQHGQSLLLLDYSGHGRSGGIFEQGTIGQWCLDALTLIDRLTEGPLLLIGSSMGGWIALLVALARVTRVTGLIGIAAAPDFTERLMWDAMPPEARDTLRQNGILYAPNAYGDALPITLGLIEDGRQHLMLDAAIPITCPVRLLHGQRDADVPWETALRLAERLESTDLRTILIKDGDHRLSRPEDLALLRAELAALLGQDRP